MSLNKLRLLSLLWLFFQTVGVSFAQETEAEVKVQAEKYFVSEQYIEATPLFSRLIALNPRSTEYNYKFGTCLLFNSYKKQDAFKYLNYSVSDPNIDPQAYFFLGKAYHLNFQFNEAIKNYQIYLDKVGGKENPKFLVQHQIQMCQNGKSLLTTLSDIVVLDKKEIAKADFFRLYNLSNIGGSILVTTDFQSKIDKKKNHIPLIHFPQNAQMIFYSSYGDSDKGHKDIYVKKRQSDGSWGDPELVAGGVNTNFDEDYPYMAPGGNYLYFSSKGHNSMGGYDIFRCKYDKARNTFGEPENLDFAISSPDDDLFYVVDSLEKNAYFASSRQSQDGKIHVYNVRVDRVPLQMSIIKGTFASTINPSNKKVQIKVTDFASGKDVGIFQSNENGDYLINLPKGGKYVYEIKVAGSSTAHKAVVNVPFTKELKPLKQKIEEVKNEDDLVIVKVTDLFNENVEDAQAIIAEVIRSKAELNVNASAFDLSYLDKQKEAKKVLADLGLDKASNQEIIAHFEELESKQNQRVTALVQMSNGSQVLIDKTADEVIELQAEVKRTVSLLNKEEDPVVKNLLLLKADEKVKEIEKKKEEIAFLKAFEDSVSKLIPNETKKLSELKTLTKDVQEQVIQENFNELKNKINEKIGVVTQVTSQSEANPVDALLHQNEQLAKQKDKLSAQNAAFDKNEQVLTAEIKQLETELAAAKSKDKDAIQSKIDAKKQELSLVQEEKAKNEEKINKISATQEELTNEVTFINTVQHTEVTAVPNKTVVSNKLADINSANNNSLEKFVKEQVKNIDAAVVASTSNSSLVSSSQTKVKSYEDDYQLSQEAVNNQSDLTPEERQALKQKNNEQFERKLDQELAKIDEALAKDPTDEGLKNQQKLLQEKKAAVVQERESMIAATQTNSKEKTEQLIAALDPSYTSKQAATEKLGEKEKLEQQNSLDNALIDKIDDALNAVYDELVKDPLNSALQQKKDGLTELKKTKEAAVEARDNRLEEILETENQNLSEITPEKELNTVAPTFKTDLVNANSKTGLERELALKDANEAALQQVIQTLNDIKKQGSGDKKVERRIEALSEVKADLEAEIAANKTKIAELQQEANSAGTTSSAKADEITKRVTPEYQANVAKINASSNSESEKNAALIKEEEKALTNLTKAQAKVDKALEKSPKDSALIQEKAILEQLEAIHDEKLNALKEKQGTIASFGLNKEQMEQELLPGFVEPTNENIASASTSELATLKQQDAKLKAAVEKEVKAVEKQLAKTNTPELTAKLKVLNEIKNDIEERNETILGRESVLASGTKTSIPSLEERLGTSFEAVMEEGPKNAEEAQAILTQLNKLEQEIASQLKTESGKNPANETVVNTLTEQQKAVSKRKGSIEAELEAMGEPVISSSSSRLKELAKQVTPKYEENIVKIEDANLSEEQKTVALLKEENSAIQAIEKALDQTQAALAKNPTDAAKQADVKALEELKTSHADKVKALESKQNAVANTSNVPSLEEKLSNSYASVMESTPTTAAEAKEVLASLASIDQQLAAQLKTESAKKPINDKVVATLTAQQEAVAQRKGVIEAELAAMGEPVATTSQARMSELAKQVTPKYEANVAKIEASNQTEEQKTVALLKEEKSAIQAIEKALDQTQSALAKNPSDAAKQADVKALEELKSSHADKVKALESKQNAVANTSNVPSLEEKLGDSYASVMESTPTTAAEAKEILASLASIEQQLAAQLKTESAKKPVNDKVVAILTAQQEAVAQRKGIIEAELAAMGEPVATTSQARMTELAKQVTPKYEANVAKIEASNQTAEQKTVALLKEENSAIQAIEKALDQTQAALAKNPSDAAKQADVKALEELKSSHADKVKTLESKQNAVANASNVPSLEEKLGDSYASVMESTPTTDEEAKTVLAELNRLEKELTDAINTESSKKTVDQAKLTTLNEQKQAVVRRKGIIEVDLSEMESSFLATHSSIETPKTKEIDQNVNNLEQEAMSLQQQKAAASKAEQKQIDKKLAQNAQEQAALKAEKESIQQEKLQEQLTAEVKSIEELSSENPLKEQVTTAIKEEKAKTSQETAEQITLADQAKNFLVQESLSDENTVVNSAGALKEQRRRFVIEIGELTQEIEALKEAKAPQAKIDEKQKLKSSLEEAVKSIDSKLNQLETENSATSAALAVSTAQVTPKEEQEIASDNRYAKFLEIQKAINKQLNERAALANAINEKRRAFDAATSAERKQKLATEIKEATARLTEMDQAIAKSNALLEKELSNAGITNQAQWKNVLSREVSPSKSTDVLAEKLAPVVKDGFEFTAPADNPKVPASSIPVGVQAPSGLVYRVQVGAFAKPIPENLFKEFTPVTGEKLDNGITRYLAGYFGDRKKVVEAQQQIRQLGYADAFVVAYCDGKRISLAEARRMEDEGLCKPMRMDSIVMQVIENTIAQLPADTIAKYKVEPKVSDYNKAPNAAPAVAIEEIQALFYTVQIGVYNRPATSEELKFVTPVVTRRLPNGQIRYATGTFRSIEEARPKRLEAIDKGITDAFITAYYKGERIPLGDAAKLLEEFGPDILIKESDLPKTPVVVETLLTPSSNTVQQKTPEVKVKAEEKYTLISKSTYNSYPRKEINRLRVYGDFYYDAASKHIVSVETTKVPALGTSGVVFDTLVVVMTAEKENFERSSLQIVASWDLADIDGTLTDWLLRLTVKHQIKRFEDRIELVLDCPDTTSYEDLEQKVIRLGGTVK